MSPATALGQSRVGGSPDSDQYTPDTNIGNYAIVEEQSSLSDSFSPSDLRYLVEGEDIILGFPDGAQVTLYKQYLRDGHGIGQFDFAGDIRWGVRELSNAIVSQQKADGLAIGSPFDEAYTYSTSEPSYTIIDVSTFRNQQDTLTFLDLDDSQIKAYAWGDIVALLDDRNRGVILDKQLDGTTHGVELVIFSNGARWNRAEIRRRIEGFSP